MRKVDAINKRQKVDGFSAFIAEGVFDAPAHQVRQAVKLKFAWLPKITLALILLSLISMTALADDIYELTTLRGLFKSGRYLVLFQNNAELRPTGGFLGSFATIEIKSGKLTKYDVEGNIYKADNEFIKTHKVPAPEPFQKIWPSSYIAFNSSNWSPDFPTAAQNVLWYYSQEYNDNSIDGVIAVNSTAVAKLAKLVGVIDLPNYNVQFTPDNFLATLQKYVEKDYYDSLENQNLNEPKEILNDLGKTMLKKLIHVNPLTLARLSQNLISEHEIQFFFSDPQKETVVKNMNWSVRIAPWDGDYIYINNANLGGGKGSLGVKQNLAYDIKTNIDGTKEVLLTITRTNIGRSDYPVGENINYTRVYVPLGASLNYAFNNGVDLVKDLQIEPEFDKTSFGFWFNTPINKLGQVRLSYTVPALKSHKLLIEHQPGTIADSVEVTKDNQKIFSGQLLSRKILDRL